MNVYFVEPAGNVEMIAEFYKKLLRRLGISVNPEKWEKSLLKVCNYMLILQLTKYNYD